MLKRLLIAVVAFIAGTVFWAYASRAVHAQAANVVHIVDTISHNMAGDTVKVSGEIIGFSCAADYGACFVMTH